MPQFKLRQMFLNELNLLKFNFDLRTKTWMFEIILSVILRPGISLFNFSVRL